MPTITGPVVGLDSAAANRLAQIVQSFESRWQSNVRPSIDDFLGELPELRSALLAELAVLDLEFRLRAGEHARTEEYLQRFADFPNTAIPDLVEAEFRGRRLREPDLDANEFLERFPSNRSTLADRLQLTAPVTTAKECTPEKPVIDGYEVLEFLGRGATGQVFKARDQRLGRVVAIKILGEDADADQRERFRRESTAAAQLHHPNIVGIYEVGATKSGRPYLVLEFVPGGTLQSELLTGPMSPADSAAALAIVARAVAHAHQHGIIHRDLKPANILVGLAESASNAQWKIADLGLARTTNSPMLTKTGAVIGTPAYMSPEQADGQEATEQSDVYALGAILYECLVGRPPFRGATVLETLDQIRRLEPVPIRHQRPTVPPDLETVCLKCLAKEPSRRYQSAGDFADDLHRWLDNQPILARPVGRLERGWLWARRNPGLATATAGIALLLTTAAIGGLAAARYQDKLRGEAQAAAKLEHERRVALRQMLDDTTSLAMAELAHSGRRAAEYPEFFQRVVATYEKLAAEDAADPQAQAELARAWARIAPILASLGRRDEAERAFSQSRILFDELARSDLRFRREAAELRLAEAGELEKRQRYPEAIATSLAAAQLFEQELDANTELVPKAVNARTIAARSAARTQRRDDARAWLEAAERLLDGHPTADAGLNQIDRVARSLQNLAAGYFLVDNSERAHALIHRAAALIPPLAEDPYHRRAAIDALASITMTLGGLHSDKREFEKADAAYRQASVYFREWLRRSPADPGVREKFARLLIDRGFALSDLNRSEESVPLLRESCEIYNGLLEDDPNNAHLTMLASDAFGRLEIVLRQLRRFDEARHASDRAIVLTQSSLELAPDQRNGRTNLGGRLVNRSTLERHLNGPAAALVWLDKAEQELQRGHREQPSKMSAVYLRNLYLKRGQLHHRLQKYPEARGDFERGLQLNHNPADDPVIRAEMALTDLALGRTTEAIAAAHALLTPSARLSVRCEAARVLSTAASHADLPDERRTELLNTVCSELTVLHREGYFRSPDVQHDLATSENWTAARARPEVARILADIGIGSKP
jgi:tetratricopeptide (TPR) repeat protein